MRSAAAVAAACLALAGCALDPNVPPLSAEVPLAYKQAGAGDPKLGPTPDWWKKFGSAELDGLVRRARDANLDIAAAAARVEAADAQVRVSTQPLIPTIAGGGDASQSYARARGTARVFSAALSASYEIDFWGKNRAQRNTALANAQASRFDQATVALSTEASVANTYLQIVALKRRLAIAKENLASAVSILEAVRGRVRFGTATSLDEAQQESLVDQLKVRIPSLEQQVEQSTHALAILLGSPPENLKVAGSSPDALRVPAISPGLPASLIERRPDIAAAEADLAAQRFDVQRARAALFPTIRLTGEGGFQSAALRTLLDPSSQFYQIAAGITQPITEQYGLQGQLDVTRANYKELLFTYQRTVLSALRDVEDALVAYKKTTQEEALQRRAVASARRAYNIATEQLRAGVIDRTTLLNTEQTLFNAEDQLVQVRLARLQSVVALYQALGGGWERAPDEVSRVP